MFNQSLYQTYKRYRTLKTNRITTLPIVILMPHSACNCRCVMCDIWKGNKNLKQLTEEDIMGLLASLKQLGTKQIVMSGGEALLNSNFFRLCELLVQNSLSITLLSTGLSLKKNADKLLQYVKDIIVSLDGDEKVHDNIRNIPEAFNKLKEGVQYLKFLNPSYRITARTVIHKLNFRNWHSIIDSAKQIGADQISFLPADVSSHAFNREIAWDMDKKSEIMIAAGELKELKEIMNRLFIDHEEDFRNGFIAESPNKIEKIYTYYSALHGFNPFPYKKCNAPWVSAVIEPDGTVKPCFFQPALGNIRNSELKDILNNASSISFRKELSETQNEICEKCVCYLNLPPGVNPLYV